MPAIRILMRLLPVAILLLIALMILQFYLARRGRPWLAWILPVLAFVGGMLFWWPQLQQVLQDSPTPGAFFATAILWLLCQIPTGIFLLLRRWGRAKRRKDIQARIRQAQDGSSF